MSDDIFPEWGSNKTVRLWICQTSMPLWVALSIEHTQAMMEQRRMTREEEKKAILSYPYETTCRCRDCRYRRIFGKRRIRWNLKRSQK